MEHWDRLRGDQGFYWDDGLFRPSTDTFLLGSFPVLRRGEQVCDLGAGTGLLGALLLTREPSLTVTGLELREFDHAIIFKVALMGKKYLTANPVKY